MGAFDLRREDGFFADVRVYEEREIRENGVDLTC